MSDGGGTAVPGTGEGAVPGARTDHVVGLLLAAGAGRRYGYPKVLAHEGRWLRTAVHALRSGGCGRVLVVLGAARAALPSGAEAVYAPRWAEGMGESLRAGLDVVAEDPDADYVAVHLVDLPDVGPDVVARTIDAATSTPSGMARAYFGATPGHPVVLGRRHWGPIAARAAGDAGAREYLRTHRAAVAAVPCGDLATGRDRDRPEELG